MSQIRFQSKRALIRRKIREPGLENFVADYVRQKHTLKRGGATR